MGTAGDLADLLRAVQRLEPDPATLTRLARMLGLGPLPAPPVAGPPGGPAPGPAVEPPGPSPASAPSGARPDTQDPLAQPLSPADPRPLRRPHVSVRRPEPAGPPRPPVPPIEELLAASTGAVPRPPDPRDLTLLPPASQRAVLGELVGALRPGLELDVAAAVSAVARRQPVSPPPRLPERTTGLGVLLLTDGSASLWPFARDVLRLVADLRAVTGSDAVQRMTVLPGPGTLMVRTPGRRSRTGRGDRDPDEPIGRALRAVPGRRALAVTDLGVSRSRAGAPDPRRAWSWLVAEARAASCPLILLVPYPPARHPDWLGGLGVTVLPWDRDADVARVRQLAALAAGRAGLHAPGRGEARR